MTPELTKPQAALEQLADLTQTLEKEKVQLTPEVEEYVRSHVRAVQDKLQAGQDVRESDLEFIAKVRTWVMMPQELREKYKSVEEMVKSDEMNDVTSLDAYEANKRHISPKQWLDLLHVAEASGKKKEWIDKMFQFPGGGKIQVEEDLVLHNHVKVTRLPEGLSVGRDLVLRGCTGLTELPEGLKVGSYLNLAGCTGLTKLPKSLSIDGHLWLSENLNEQVKKDASKLKWKRKIKGEIIGGPKTFLSSTVNKIHNLLSFLK